MLPKEHSPDHDGPVIFGHRFPQGEKGRPHKGPYVYRLLWDVGSLTGTVQHRASSGDDKEYRYLSYFVNFVQWAGYDCGSRRIPGNATDALLDYARLSIFQYNFKRQRSPRKTPTTRYHFCRQG